MSEDTRQKLVDDHFLFMNGDLNLKIAGMERDWPEGRGLKWNIQIYELIKTLKKIIIKVYFIMKIRLLWFG